MKLVFLGTGTSTGVPQLRCRCATCTSSDPRDKRLRASVMIQTEEGAPWILIDCGPDFRQQMLNNGSPDLACVLITHTHYDHVGGIDDLRPYCPTAPDGHFPVYCRKDVATDMRNRVPYCFARKLYPGVPTFNIHEIDAPQPFIIEIPGFKPVEVKPLRIMHAALPILGFRIGKLVYITDCSHMPQETLDEIRGAEVLVINALRHTEHPSHINLLQALNVIKETGPAQAYLTHMSHQMGPQAETEKLLPSGTAFAFDGLTVEIND